MMANDNNIPDYSKFSKKQLIKTMTDKQKIFCHEYIIDWNGSRAARKAGYSEDTARSISCENLTKPYIVAYIDLIKNDLEHEAGITKLSQLIELKKIGYSNLSDYHDSWITLSEFESIPKDLKSCIQEISTKIEQVMINESPIEVKYVKIKLYDKPRALEIINKMMGYNEPDNINISGISKKSISDLFPDENDINGATD